MEVLEPIPADTGLEVGYTLEYIPYQRPCDL